MLCPRLLSALCERESPPRQGHRAHQRPLWEQILSLTQVHRSEQHLNSPQYFFHVLCMFMFNLIPETD